MQINSRHVRHDPYNIKSLKRIKQEKTNRSIYTIEVPLIIPPKIEGKSITEQYTQIFNDTVRNDNKEKGVFSGIGREGRHYYYKNITQRVFDHYYNNEDITHTSTVKKEKVMSNFDKIHRESQRKASDYIRKTIQSLNPITTDQFITNAFQEAGKTILLSNPRQTPATPIYRPFSLSLRTSVELSFGMKNDNIADNDLLDRTETPLPPEDDHADELADNGTELSDWELELLSQNHFDGDINAATVLL